MQRIKSKSLTNEVKDSIYKYIKSLDLSKDTKLPSEENMAQLIGVSRITIRSALNELASEGIIFRRQGKGTFVNSEALQMKAQLNPVKQFTDIIESSGYKSSIKALGYEIINSDFNLSKLLKIKENEPLVAVRKIFYADKNPCTYCVDYFPLSLLEDKNECDDLDKYDDSIFKFLRDKAKVSISWDKVEIGTVTNLENDELNNQFECRDNVKSFLLLEGINFDENDRPVMYIKEYIDTTFIRFNIIRQRLI
ncbi:MAG: GntR family transcriptional regulator [Terrisporobacter sp.]|uniref:GntR family transcriptional regulator n=1 Tax=Terrisporobacter sp. TaxID=1965305 RepID=UPI002FC5B415